jgi:hypothetical protein
MFNFHQYNYPVQPNDFYWFCAPADRIPEKEKKRRKIYAETPMTAKFG